MNVRRRKGSHSVSIESLESRQMLALSFSPIATTGTVQLASIDTDSSGNIYVVGVFSGQTTFDKAGKIKLTAIGDNDGFIMRVAAKDGATIVRRLACTSAPQGVSKLVSPMKIVVKAGHALVVGQFAGRVDLDPGKGIRTFDDTGNGDAFVLDLNATALTLNWATAFGGTGSDAATAVDRDSKGNLWVDGYFQKTLAFPTSPAHTLKSAGGFDTFIAKYSSSGAYQFSARVGGSSDDVLASLAVDNKDNVFFAGNFKGTIDTNPGSAKSNLTSASNTTSGVIIELNSAGAFKASRGFSDTSFASVTDIDTDSKGNLYSLINFDGTIDTDPTSKVANLTTKGAGDVLLMKFDTTLKKLWQVTFGSTITDQGQDLYIDSKDQIAVCGTIQGGVTDLDPSKNKALLTTDGDQDGFISLFDSAGKFKGAAQLGGSGASDVIGVARSGTQYVGATLCLGSFDLHPRKLPGNTATPSLVELGSDLRSDLMLVSAAILGTT